jgi:hypothetical protein
MTLASAVDDRKKALGDAQEYLIDKISGTTRCRRQRR